MKFASGNKHMCDECASVPYLQSFKRRLVLRAERIDESGNRNLNNIRFEYLTKAGKVKVLRETNKVIEMKSSDLSLLEQTALRLKLRVLSLKERLTEFSRRGDMKAICHQLTKAEEKGLLKEKRILMDTLETVSKNFNVKGKTGQRYKKSVKKFYESLLIMGGPRICNFVAISLEGPSSDAIYKWRKVKLVKFKPGLWEENFKQVLLSLKDLMEMKGVPKIPWLAAEDETAIEKVISYHQETDELLGFCGLKRDNPDEHQCLGDVHIVVGDDDRSYQRIIGAFNDYKIGNYAKVILLNPMHKNLPRVVVCLVPTCNRFIHYDVCRQWQSIERHFEEHLEDVIGPLFGHSSDSDSQWRKLMFQLMSVDVSMQYRPIPLQLGFVFSAKKEVLEDSSYVIRDKGDQDPIHNHKKYINHLDHVSRIIHIGPGCLVLMNHVEMVVERIPVLRHGLNRDHVRRDRDLQNWKVAQELRFLRVQECISSIIDETADNRPCDPSLRGTLALLKVIWHYVEIIFSPVLPLKDRIKYAGFVSQFLGIWRNFIYWEPNLSISQSFISNQTYTDILL